MAVSLVKILTYVLIYIAVLYAIVFHEIAHGLMAYKFGDPTPKNEKRLSLNPLRHLSLVGSFLVPLVLILTISFAFGWAKPVRIKEENLKNKWRDMAVIGLAGPSANFCCAIIASLIIRFLLAFSPNPSNVLFLILITVLSMFVFVNLLLMLFNLVPIPPLDGGHVLCALLPKKIAEELQMAALPLFVIIIFLFMAFGAQILLPTISFMHRLMTGLVTIR